MIRVTEPSVLPGDFLNSIQHETNSLVLVDFYADWCEPCKWLDEILIRLDADFANSVSVIKVDIEKNEALRAEYNIRSVPVLALFENGKVVWRMNGFLAIQEMEDLLKRFIKKHPEL